jgi:hypothetical protein
LPPIVATYLWVRRQEAGPGRQPRRLQKGDVLVGSAVVAGGLAAVLVALRGGSAAVGRTFEVGSSPWTTGMVLEHQPLSRWLACLGLAIVLMTLWLGVYRQLGARLDWSFALLFAPFGILIVGTDWARFASLVFFSTLLVAPTFLKVTRAPSLAPLPRWFPVPLLLLCVPLGPVGIIDFFPYLGFLAAIKH